MRTLLKSTAWFVWLAFSAGSCDSRRNDSLQPSTRPTTATSQAAAKPSSTMGFGPRDGVSVIELCGSDEWKRESGAYVMIDGKRHELPLVVLYRTSSTGWKFAAEVIDGQLTMKLGNKLARAAATQPGDLEIAESVSERFESPGSESLVVHRISLGSKGGWRYINQLPDLSTYLNPHPGSYRVVDMRGAN